MAESLNAKEVFTIEEVAVSNMWEMAALLGSMPHTLRLGNMTKRVGYHEDCSRQVTFAVDKTPHSELAALGTGPFKGRCADTNASGFVWLYGYGERLSLLSVGGLLAGKSG